MPFHLSASFLPVAAVSHARYETDYSPGNPANLLLGLSVKRVPNAVAPAHLVFGVALRTRCKFLVPNTFRCPALHVGLLEPETSRPHESLRVAGNLSTICRNVYMSRVGLVA